MKGEKLLMELAIEKGKKVLGVCLGAQLIASVLGAKVYAPLEPARLVFDTVRLPSWSGVLPLVVAFIGS